MNASIRGCGKVVPAQLAERCSWTTVPIISHFCTRIGKVQTRLSMPTFCG